LAFALIEPHFQRRATVDRATHQVMGQERGTLRRFLEVCGDRPVDCYSRGDVSTFLDTLRRLPNTYGRSPKDKDRPLTDIIAEADAKGSPRLVDKTVKRHLTALSQFFQFAVDRGYLSVAARAELVENHRFREGNAAREQRDAWTPDELKALFTSPIWTGSRQNVRSQPGPHIIRDAKFWLPLLALFHGGRLEEFADLYGRDVGCEDGVWFLRITETEDRRLKTDNAERVLPLHPEVVRLGFLDYVRDIAPTPGAPLFPDLEPQGKDRRRGPRFTRFFVNYRKAIGVYRGGVGMHAFRHTANTRLRDAISNYQQERHVNYLMGHAQGGGEGRERYDKGPGLKAVAETLALLRYPELDLSKLYVTAPMQPLETAAEVAQTLP
jgi:integrase